LPHHIDFIAKYLAISIMNYGDSKNSTYYSIKNSSILFKPFCCITRGWINLEKPGFLFTHKTFTRKKFRKANPELSYL
jgi:hypothetical protein